MKNKCIYPDWEGGFWEGKHNFGKNENNDYCIICGKTKEQCKITPSHERQ